MHSDEQPLRVLRRSKGEEGSEDGAAEEEDENEEVSLSPSSAIDLIMFHT